MKKVRVLYISIEGNSRNFMERVEKYSKQKKNKTRTILKLKLLKLVIQPIWSKKKSRSL
nr:hypothetical protein [Oenococcus oeni]